MDRRRLLFSLIASLLVVTATGGYLASGATPNLGLDLQGGISAIYSPVIPEGETLDLEVLDETIEVIRARVDSLGVAEPDISRQGEDVLVQLPGLEDPQRAQEIIGTTAQLTFRPVDVSLFPGTPQYELFPPCIEGGPNTLDLGLDDPATTPDDDGTEDDTEGVGPQGPVGADEGTDEPSEDTSETADPDESADPSESEGQSAGDPRVVAAAEGETEPADEPSDGETATDEPSDGETTSDDPTDAPSDEPTDEPAPTLDELLGDLQLYRTGDEFPNDVAGVVCAPADDSGAFVDPATNLPVPIKYVVSPAALTGDNIEDALPVLGASGWEVSLDFDGEGADAFAAITAELACRRDQGQGGAFAIVLDNVVESAPTPNAGSVLCGVGITGGRATITVGGATAEDGGQSESQALALVLRTGALPITLEPSTFETVSPTLGADSLRSGLIAGILGLVLVAGYLIFFYRWLGIVAIGSLVTFGVLMLGLITGLGEIGFTLTLAGIAGIIVSIGITADSSILFFERIRDEANSGKTIRTSVKRAFASAFRTNLAGNTVTLAAAIILYFLAVGPVRGFALTLGVATILDLLILYFFTRPAVGLLSQGKRLTRTNLRAREMDPRPTRAPRAPKGGPA